MFALVDGNNFFASCERVFRPELEGKPVVVLSNNDGCVIARTAEAKALGIKMGAPWFKLKGFARQHNVVAHSVNFALYADMSNRMMNVLAQFSPRLQANSIDECFLDLNGFTHLDLVQYGQEIRQRLRQWLGLPVCVGIASTKTLAKLANQCAKDGLAGRNGVCDFNQLSAQERSKLFTQLSIGDIWGVGRKLRERLQERGLMTIEDLRCANGRQLRKEFSITMERMVDELNGISCLEIEDLSEASQQIISSRSFGNYLYDIADLQEAVATHIAHAADKLRKQNSWAQAVHVALRTNPNREGDDYYQQGLSVPLREASNDTLRLTRAALWGLQRIYKPGYAYQKTGIVLLNLCNGPPPQADLFAPTRDDPKLMAVMDRINATFGTGTLHSAAEGTAKRWLMRQEHRSRRYSTVWQEMLRVGKPAPQAAIPAHAN